MNLWRTKIIAGIALACFFTSSAYTEDWKEKGEHNGVRLSTRDFPNSSIPEFKATTEIANSMARVVAVLLDIEACPQWIHQCDRSLILDQPSVNENIIYQVNKIPFAKDRDILMRASLTATNQAKRVNIALRLESHYCEQNLTSVCADINNSPYIRVTQFIGEYRLLELNPNLIEVTWQQHIDPGGNLPSWLIKSQLDDLAFKTLAGLRKQVKKNKYKDAKLRVNGDNIEFTNLNF